LLEKERNIRESLEKSLSEKESEISELKQDREEILEQLKLLRMEQQSMCNQINSTDTTADETNHDSPVKNNNTNSSIKSNQNTQSLFSKLNKSKVPQKKTDN